MEEQIRWILTRNTQDAADGVAHNIDKSSKEIAETFERFMEWTNQNCPFWYEQISNTWLDIAEDGRTAKVYNLKELFTYWNTNIKDK